MLKEKLEIAKNIRLSSKRFSKNVIHKKLFKKIYRTYVIECILKGKDSFQLRFNGKYINSLSIRIYDWLEYIQNIIERSIFLIIVPKKFRSKKKFPFLYYRIFKPTHLKLTNAPNEFILNSFLEHNGFKIIKEHLGSVETTYDIARI